ncbi:MAG: adenylosuccinate synthase [Phycisphaerae bacterium]
MPASEIGNTCVIGLQWGDEGKGKIVDMLTEHVDISVRYSGGANAGHTVLVGSEKFALHQLPSGILRKKIVNVITGGTVIDPGVLLGEMAALRARDVEVTPDRLKISDRAHLVFPYHRREDVLAEGSAPVGEKLGTTARGIGPCYADKTSRHYGLRICDLFRPDHFRERLRAIVNYKNALFSAAYSSSESFDPEKLADEYLAFAAELKPFVCDTTTFLNEQLRSGKKLMFEGSQGALLDVDHGTYPFVTSTSATGGGIASGAGVPTTTLTTRIGILKAYSTRVGSGPFPTELKGAFADDLRKRGGEYGTTTGRPRRIGWLDLVAARYAATLLDPTHLALLHLDTLSGLEEVSVCTAYRHEGKILNTVPADAYTYEAVEPVLQTVPGWSEDVSKCRSFADLPANTQRFVRLVGEHVGAPVRILGIGPERSQTIWIEESA